MRTVPVHPVPVTRSADAGPAPTPLYRLVACRPLPAFDPVPSIKRSVFPPSVVKLYDAWFRRTRGMLVPLYCLGLTLRLVSYFSPRSAIDPLAVTSAVCLTPLCFISFLDMRRDLVVVLLKSFDFWFLGATSLIWTAAVGAAMGTSAQLVTLPALWLEVVIGTLTDSFLTVRLGFTMTSVSVLVSILTLVLGVSLDLTTNLDYSRSVMAVATTNFTLSLRDVILNAMGTVAIFYMRVMFLSVHGVSRRRRDPTNTRIQSVLVHCALRWEVVQASKYDVQGLRTVDSTATPVVPISLAVVRLQERPRLLQMTPIAIPRCDMLVADDTVYQQALRWTRLLHRVLPTGLTAVGAVGAVGTVVGLTTAFEAPRQDPARAPSPVTTADIISFVALASTTVYGAALFGSCQRQLLRHTVATFNFVFLSIQLALAHLCLCDVFYWRRDKVISVVASWVWMNMLLAVDALSPAMKRRLGFKTWHLLPVVVLAIAGQAALGLELVVRDRWKLQNRVVLSVQVREGRRVHFHSGSLLLGRLATLTVWFLRLLYRFYHRSSDDELVLVQGGAEFDYIAWKRLATVNNKD